MVDYATKSTEFVFYQQDVKKTETVKRTNIIVMKIRDAGCFVSKDPIADQTKNARVTTDVALKSIATSDLNPPEFHLIW